MVQTSARMCHSDAVDPIAIDKVVRRSARRRFLLKVALTVVVFGAIFASVDWAEIGERLESASLIALFSAVLVLIASIMLASLRWSMVAEQHGMALSLWPGLSITFAAHFFGQVLPSTVGADAVRSWLAVRQGLAASRVVASVVVDRVCGLLGLALLILFGLPQLLNLSGVQNSLVVALMALLLAAGVGGSVALLLLARRFRLRGVMGRIQELFVGSAQALASMKGLGAVGLSVVVQVLVVLSVVLIAWSVNLPFGLIDGLATVPVAMLIAFIPITVNGWGLREGAMITAMGLTGVSSADALVVSVLFGVSLLVASLPGAITYFSLRHSR